MLTDPILGLIQKSEILTKEVLERAWDGKWFALILFFIERYIFSDWPFLIWLLVLIVLDTFLGLGNAFIRWEINPKKFGGILVKGVVYGSVLIFGHVFENVEISGNTIPGGVYLKMTLYVGVVVVEGISIIRNLGKINPSLVPKFILKRMEGFNETGDFNELTKRNEESQ